MLKKTNWLIERVQKKFQLAWNPAQINTVDEGIAATKCFLSGIRVYMPDKPVSISIVYKVVKKHSIL